MRIINLYNRLFPPFRLVWAKHQFRGQSPLILDIGCGNHSPVRTLQALPGCVYHGLDRGSWNSDAADRAACTRYFQVDLDDAIAMQELPQACYDLVVMSHVLEHLENPEEVLRRCIPLIKPGGYIYIELPSERSLRLPCALNGWGPVRGCLNYRDDTTHLAMPDITALYEMLGEAGFVMTPARYARLLRKIVFMPLIATVCLAVKGFVPASVLWDITGFSVYITARRLPCP